MKAKLLVIAVLILHLVLLIILPFTAWPEMMVRPYLMLNGWLPYKDIIMEHNPLLLVDLAIFNKLFGVGLLQLKIYTWIWIMLTDIVLLLVAKKLWNLKTALVALIFYIPLQIIYEGNGLWFDLTLASLALLIFYSLRRKEYLWAGIFFAIGFFLKQTAAWFIFPILYHFLKDLIKKNYKSFILLTEGFLIILALALGVMAIVGILPYFFQWAVKYGIFHLPSIDEVASLPTRGEFIIFVFPFLFTPLLLFLKRGKDKDIAVWTLFSLMGVYPRFALFHFQPALPFLVIGVGLVFINTFKAEGKRLKIAILGYLIIILAFTGRQITRNWEKEDRFYGQNEVNVFSFVKAEVVPGEEIYVLNYWDSIYAMTQTVPATKPSVPFLPWYLEYDDLKDGLVGDILVDLPELIVAGEYTGSGLGSYRIERIDEILDRYYTLTYGVNGVKIYQINR